MEKGFFSKRKRHQLYSSIISQILRGVFLGSSMTTGSLLYNNTSGTHIEACAGCISVSKIKDGYTRRFPKKKKRKIWKRRTTKPGMTKNSVCSGFLTCCLLTQVTRGCTHHRRRRPLWLTRAPFAWRTRYTCNAPHHWYTVDHHAHSSSIRGATTIIIVVAPI